MQSWTYATGGLTLRSEVRLAAAEIAPPAPVDIDLVLRPGGVPAGRLVVERFSPGDATPYLRVLRTEDGYLLDHADGILLEVTRGGRHIVVRRLEPSLDDSARAHLFLDHLLPLVFAHLGRLSFHGSAVALAKRALCFLADSHTGKSTLAAALVRHAGAHFLADDEIVLEAKSAGFEVHPSHPSVRLWNESAAVLFAAEHREHGKHHMPFSALSAAVPLAAMVLLEPGRVDQADPVEIEHLGARDGMMGIATHLDRLDPSDRAALRREIEALARLAERTSIVRMRVARDLARLPEIALRVREWCPSLRGADH